MEITKTKTIKTKVHYIYCDKCKKLIATESEYDDGWYEDHEETINLSFGNIGDFELRVVMCENCYKEFEEKLKKDVVNFINSLGFKKREGNVLLWKD